YGLHGGLEITFEHAMPLEGLARRDAQAPGRPSRCDMIKRQPLIGGDDPAGQAGADHEGIGGLELAFAPVLADVAVILLIASVEFQQLVVVVADRSGYGVCKSLLNGAAQVAAIYLDFFQVGKRGGHMSPD